MLTRLVADAIKDGYSEEFCRLLYNWGLWSRYSGCRGYLRMVSESRPTPVIDDNSASVVDKAVCRLKRDYPNVHLLLEMYYIKGMNEVAIAYRMRHRGLYRINLIVGRDDVLVSSALRYLTSATARDLIIWGEKKIYEYLVKESEDAQLLL